MTLRDLFVYCALLGGALFLVQVVLGLLGAGDADAPFGGHDPSSTGHTSADTAFKILSVQGLTAFFGMFGLVGLAMLQESGASATYATLGALLGGALTTWVIARIFRAAHKLEVTGTLDMRRAVGAVGTVYLHIGPDKPGKVTVTVGGRLLTVDAMSDQTLETGVEVRVVRVLSDGSVSVVKEEPGRTV